MDTKNEPPKLKPHPIANLIPPMTPAVLDDLIKDIEASGQRVPIITFKGKILDGRSRYAACTRLKIEPTLETFTGSLDAARGLVLSLNLQRRHLNNAQKALIGLALLDAERKAALKRMRKGGATDKSQEAGEAPDLAGRRVGLSGRSLQRAAAALERCPGIVKAIYEGEANTVADMERQAARDAPRKHATVWKTPPKAGRPLLSYYGGKQRVAAKICSLMPPHSIYVEPFCGGAAVLFSKGIPGVANTHHYREVLNDRDERLVILYRVCQDAHLRAQLLDRLRATPFSRAEHQRAGAILDAPDGHTEVERAWAIYVELNQGYASLIGGGWRASPRGQNQAATWDSRLGRLEGAMERLADVALECDDALAVIKRWDTPATCFYVDPPYPETDQGHYSGYTQEDFEALIDVLKSIKGSAMVSCYGNPAIPKNWARFEIPSICQTAKPGEKERVEVVAIKPRSGIVCEDLASHMWTPAV